MAQTKKPAAVNATRHGFHASRGRIFVRFRRMNIMLFTLAFLIMAMVMVASFRDVITDTSSEYASLFARSTSEALSAHMNKDIGLMSKAAQSAAVIEWMADEGNKEKADLAHQEMAGIVDELYSYNLYVGLDSSLNEYRVDSSTIEKVDVFDKNNPKDSWYFDCISSDRDYILSVDRDYMMQRKRVWIDYKVVRDDVPVGVICTGLEFAHVARELFAHYDKNNMRGIVIDNAGIIRMDSSFMDDREFLHGEFQSQLEDVLDDPRFLSSVESHVNSIDSYFDGASELKFVRLSRGFYRHMTISPIRDTNWSVIILSGPISFFEISRFIPVFVAILALLIIFAVITSAFNYRLIFLPLSKLGQSLVSLRENLDVEIYGTQRDDEIGDLSQTVQDLFHKANVDGLTGIYNRRFMENNLEHIMGLLSRSNSLLSVLMLDIDFFKKYNDTYGHEEGDSCLKKVAKVLESCAVRANDFAARYGGEEFLIVLPNTDESGARVVAEKLLDGVRALNIPHSNSTAAEYVTVSVGVASGRVAYGQRWDDFVKRADDALYTSKEGGRNRYTYLDYS